MYGVSFELAIIQWTVPFTTYIPEMYRIVYNELIDDEVPAQTMASDLINGTTDLTAQNVQYAAVLRSLRPGTSYSYSISASNTVSTRFTPSATFFTSPARKYECPYDCV